MKFSFIYIHAQSYLWRFRWLENFSVCFPSSLKWKFVSPCRKEVAVLYLNARFFEVLYRKVVFFFVLTKLFCSNGIFIISVDEADFPELKVVYYMHVYFGINHTPLMLMLSQRKCFCSLCKYWNNFTCEKTCTSIK